ncbi:Mor transcription activator family protein [Vibrio sp. M260112]|uniref:Mor transcription activator family protein n=1 Tax=Vibrio sp. M260112 TaxID=3020895 RepID=UPI002F423AF5
MEMNWIEIAKNKDAVNIALTVLKDNSGIDWFFDEFIAESENLGIDKSEAFKLICVMISILGGQQVYLPKEVHFNRYLSYRLIYSDFNGNNTNEVAKKHNVSAAHVIRVVKACAKADREARNALEGVI